MATSSSSLAGQPQRLQARQPLTDSTPRTSRRVTQAHTLPIVTVTPRAPGTIPGFKVRDVRSRRLGEGI